MNSRSKVAAEVPNERLQGDERWVLALRVAHSQQFAKAAKLRNFLVYVCQAALENRSEEINEQQIGSRVFERPLDYNANDDNIVRSQARLLRHKLDAYFAAEGLDERIILRIPKGGYVPEFVERPKPEAPPVLAHQAESHPEGGKQWKIAVAALSAAVLILVICLAWVTTHTGLASASPPTPGLNSLWSQLFDDKLTTTVVVPDHTFAMVQETSGKHADLSAYVRRSPPPDDPGSRLLSKLLPSFPIRRYTTFDGVSTTVRVLQLAQRFPSKAIIRYARDITLRDISPGHLVLIGRPTSNPWVELFESKLNFLMYSDLPNHVVLCRNTAPAPGEQAEYLPKEEGAKRTVYASIAFLKNLNGGGNVLIVGGASSGSQEGAAEFVTNEKLFGGFARTIGHGSERIPYFDVLIRTVTIDGLAQEPAVVAYRVLKG